MSELATVNNEAVKTLENYVLGVEQTDLQTKHCLSGGVYARTIFIPAGTILTGATHKKDHINIVHGDISVTTDTGLERITGYHVLPTKAGSKRAGFAHADTYWTTVCETKNTEIEEIEDELVEESSQLQTRVNVLPATNFTELEA